MTVTDECAWKMIVRLEIEKFNCYKQTDKKYSPVILPKGDECFRCDGDKKGVCEKYMVI